MHEKQRFVDDFQEFTSFGYDPIALAVVPFRVQAQVVNYKLQLRQYYRENRENAPVNSDWITQCSPNEIKLGHRLEFANGLMNPLPLTEHAINFNELLTTAFTHSGTILNHTSGFAHFVKPTFILSASVIKVATGVDADAVVDDVVDTIFGGFQGAIVFFDTVPVKNGSAFSIRQNFMFMD